MEIGGFFYQPEPVPVEWRLFRKTRGKMGDHRVSGCSRFRRLDRLIGLSD